jgi:type IV fimbrial biogenesis protein FimT
MLPLPHVKDDTMPSKGFTLLELLVAVVITATLAALAAPSLNHALSRQQLRSITHQLHTSLNLARQAAITRRQPVLVRNKGGDWSKGWTVFVDADNDGLLDVGEDILLQVEAVPGSLRISSNFGNYARYRANGRSAYVNGAFMAGAWLVCSGNSNTTGHKLVMSAGGRVRSSARIGSACG